MHGQLDITKSRLSNKAFSCRSVSVRKMGDAQASAWNYNTLRWTDFSPSVLECIYPHGPNARSTLRFFAGSRMLESCLKNYLET